MARGAAVSAKSDAVRMMSESGSAPCESRNTSGVAFPASRKAADSSSGGRSAYLGVWETCDTLTRRARERARCPEAAMAVRHERISKPLACSRPIASATNSPMLLTSALGRNARTSSSRSKLVTRKGSGACHGSSAKKKGAHPSPSVASEDCKCSSAGTPAPSARQRDHCAGSKLFRGGGARSSWAGGEGGCSSILHCASGIAPEWRSTDETIMKEKVVWCSPCSARETVA